MFPNNKLSNSITKTEIYLHWIVAIGMVLLIGVGIYMHETETYDLYPIHKSFGVLLFIVILARIIVRIRTGWLENVSKGAMWEHKLARFIHWVLIIGTVIMPISGILDSTMSGRGLYIFGLELMAGNMDISGKPIAINKDLSGLGEEMHEICGYVLIAVIVLHLLGALKHHFFDKDSTLRRMLGKS